MILNCVNYGDISQVSIWTNSRLRESIHDLWIQVVTDHTRRDLTVEHACLAALLGVTQAIQHQIRDERVAGLSKKYLA